MKSQFVYFSVAVILLISCESKKSHSSSSKPNKNVNRELVLIDSVFTHQNSDSDDKYLGFSIFFPADTLPDDWASPVNYKDGDLYYRVSVLSKADNRLVYYQVGFQWYGGCEGNIYKEKISFSTNIQFTETGVYDTLQSVPSFWEPDCQATNPIHWVKPDKILVVVRDEFKQVIDDRWGYGSGIENLYGYYPIQVHLQLVLVAQGKSFSGWENYTITEP